MNITTAQLAELLMLARHASPSEFFMLFNALRQSVCVPNASLPEAIDLLERLAREEAEQKKEAAYG